MNYQWIDALEFNKKGGWSDETQFAHEIGQSYLMAINYPGVPVEDAVTDVTFNQSGMYRIWVRTKNWRQPESPGRFKIVVDDNILPNEMGMKPRQNWYWEISGDVYLKEGAHKLRVRDTSGWFGRFASIIITDDMDYTPSPEVDKLLEQRSKIKNLNNEPANMGNFDVIVAGGGPGGVPAAIAAARKGMKVALLQSRPGLGGNGGKEALVNFNGASISHVNMREAGIAEDMYRYRCYNYTNYEDAMKMIINNEPNIKVFYNQFVIDACVEDNIIKSVKTLDCIDSQYRIYNAKYFVDCTGDGWLGYYAGAKYRIGREARWQYDESLAPETPDDITMSGCLMGTQDGSNLSLSYHAEDVGHPVAFTAPDWAVKLPREIYRDVKYSLFKRGYWWIENPGDFDDLWEQENIRDELLRLSLGFFHWMKNEYKDRDLLKNYDITFFPRYNAKRESRRLIGDYVLSQDDCLNSDYIFDDVIAYSGWGLDLHHPKGIYSGKEGPFYSNNRTRITPIPYRCIYSKNIENLLMAGRCISVSHIALGTTRVQNTIATIGQAAGTAASMCIKWNTNPRGIYKNHMREFQHILQRDDQYIPWLTDTDPKDLAPKAKISATSVKKNEYFSLKRGREIDWSQYNKKDLESFNNLDNQIFEEWIPLDIDKACFVYSASTPEFIKVKLKNNTNINKNINVYITEDTEKLKPLEEVSISIPKHFNDWLEIPFNLSKIKKKRWGLVIKHAKGVYWHNYDFSMGQYGMVKIDQYRWKKQMLNSFSIKYKHENLPLCNCEPNSLICSNLRHTSPQRYGWVSDPNEVLPQSITLNWDKPYTFNCVQLTFDTDMLNPSHAVAILPVAPETVKDYRIDILKDDKWCTLIEEKGNFLRHRVHEFSTVTAQSLKITVLSTYGDRSARMFEVRVYND